MRFQSIIPFIIASLATLASVIGIMLRPGYENANGELVTYQVNSEILFAAIALCLIGFLLLLKIKNWKYLFLVVILFSWSGIFQFIPFGFHISIGFMVIDCVALGILSLHLLANPDLLVEISTIIPKAKINSDGTENREMSEQRISHFEEKFKSKNQQELERIIKENDRIPEAVEAARRLYES